MNLKKKKLIDRFGTGAILWLVALVFLIPVLLIIWNSLKTRAEANLMNFAWPSAFHWENYTYVWENSDMLRSFGNSMLIASGSVAISTIAAALSAFALSRNSNKLHKGIHWLLMIGLVLPLNMLPTIRVLRSLHIYGSFLGIILLYSALLIPMAFFLYYSFIKNIPKTLDEAALLDGANGFTLFFRIILPNLKPVTITVIVINFMYAWNDFLTPLYMLNNSNKWGMVQAVYNYYGFYQTDWSYICAVIMLTLIPVIVVYIFGQKYIISGMTAGAVKG